MRYVALLRGVNVGGKRRVLKQDFIEVLKTQGFYDITIYINSGNAVFSSSSLIGSSDLQPALEHFFGFSIPTLVLTGERIKSIANVIPATWSNDSPSPDKLGQKSDVLYLFSQIDSPTILNQLTYNQTIETVLYTPGALITNISRLNQPQSGLHKLTRTKLYNQMTIRNINTAKKLAELV